MSSRRVAQPLPQRPQRPFAAFGARLDLHGGRRRPRDRVAWTRTPGPCGRPWAGRGKGSLSRRLTLPPGAPSVVTFARPSLLLGPRPGFARLARWGFSCGAPRRGPGRRGAPSWPAAGGLSCAAHSVRGTRPLDFAWPAGTSAGWSRPTPPRMPPSAMPYAIGWKLVARSSCRRPTGPLRIRPSWARASRRRNSSPLRPSWAPGVAPRAGWPSYFPWASASAHTGFSFPGAPWRSGPRSRAARCASSLYTCPRATMTASSVP